jgi:Mg-chelatase subunit ChlD
MLAELGPAPSKYTKFDALTDAVDSFLDCLTLTIPEEHVSLVWYNHDVGLSQALTSDYQAIRDAMGNLGPEGNTAIGLGLQEGVRAVTDPATARHYAHKTVIVMTDGIHNSGIDPDAVAEDEVNNHSLQIHTITFGTDADQILMQEVAQIGGGRHWHAETTSALEEAYVDIAKELPTVLTK